MPGSLEAFVVHCAGGRRAPRKIDPYIGRRGGGRGLCRGRKKKRCGEGPGEKPERR